MENSSVRHLGTLVGSLVAILVWEYSRPNSGTQVVFNSAASAWASVVVPVDSAPTTQMRLANQARTGGSRKFQFVKGSVRITVPETGTAARAWSTQMCFECMSA